MAASTTLVTFMVRTPPTTRSVALYGSWDNFSTAYPMSRDSRLGIEHWTGCHNFENIICDGNVEGLERSRNGGLKMGGTYWYYYKLDDEIEFHNSAEPATARCPLLPGQLVNELQVPVALSGNRQRAPSVSSTSSERRTLDPEAKFVNPRPVPSAPKLVRLNTSPTLLQATPVDVGSHGGIVSAAPLMQTDREEQFRIASSRGFHLPRKPSLDGLLKIGSGKKNFAGLRQAFKSSEKAVPSSKDEKYQNIINWIPERQADQEDDQSIKEDAPSDPPLAVQSARTSFDQPQAPRGVLMLRKNSEEAVPLASFREHRRQQSGSRSRSGSARNSIALNQAAHLDLHSKRPVEKGPLSALMEVPTPGLTPGYGPETGRRITLEALEGRCGGPARGDKRLPTLPDTPTSAMPLTGKSFSDNICSRFSTTTIDTTCHLDSLILDDEQQRQLARYMGNSNWSPVSDSTIEDSICSPGIVNDQLNSALRPLSSNVNALADLSESSDYHSSHIRASTLTCTTISSSVSTTPTFTSYSEDDFGKRSRFSDATSIRTSTTSIGQFQHYKLPEADSPQAVTPKYRDSKPYGLVDGERFDSESEAGTRTDSISHSEGMQQLMNELSYLSNVIQR